MSRFKKIIKEFNYRFNTTQDGLYSITLEATCKSGKILGLFGGEDLRVEIDGIKLREIPARGRPQYFNIPPAWNGTKLKGLSKIVVFILYLNKGKHLVKFAPKRSALIKKEPEVKIINQRDKILQNIQAQDGNRRPWITFALIDLPLNIIDVSATCEKRFKDSDDIKLVIDGKVQKNEQAKIWGKNWYWRGSKLEGNTKEARFYPNLSKGSHYIEFWADRRPVLSGVRVDLGPGAEDQDQEVNSKDVKLYIYKGPVSKQDYNRYDTEIEKAVIYWNKEFLNDKYPVKEPLDPNLVKAIIYQESKMGYYSGGEVDIMQVGHPDDPALKTLNGELEEWWIDNGKKKLLDYGGRANAETPEDSVKWGARWLYHKAQGITENNERYWRSWKEAVRGYGPGTKEYVDNVWNIYTKGVDKKNNIKLWSFILAPFLLLFVSLWIYFNQGQVYFKYKDIGEEHIGIGRVWLEIGILDGFKVKKGTIGPIEDRTRSSNTGLLKETILVDYYDFDNDGQDDVLVSAEHSTGYEVRYFFRIGEKDLEKIHFVNYSNPYTGDNSFYAENIIFGPRDGRNRYTFIEEDFIRRSTTTGEMWRTYYRFDENQEIVLDRVEKEQISLISSGF